MLRLEYSFEKAELKKNKVYAVVYGDFQNRCHVDLKDDELIWVESDNIHDEELGVLNPFTDMDGKDLSENESYELYGKEAVDRFIKDVAANDQITILYEFGDEENTELYLVEYYDKETKRYLYKVFNWGKGVEEYNSYIQAVKAMQDYYNKSGGYWRSGR